LVGDLRVEVADLQAQLASQPDVDAEVQAAADRLGETVGKFDSILPALPPAILDWLPGARQEVLQLAPRLLSSYRWPAGMNA
jgi:hypothetical protein